jgi:hypothetical protein
MFEQGRSERISNVVYGRCNKRVILADTILGLSGKKTSGKGCLILSKMITCSGLSKNTVIR